MKVAADHQDMDTVQDHLDDLEVMFKAHKMNPYFEQYNND